MIYTGCPRIGDAHPDVLVILGYAPLKQISSLLTLASTQHGNTLRIENTGSTSWKLLRSSSGLARDDDDLYWSRCNVKSSGGRLVTRHGRHVTTGYRADSLPTKMADVCDDRLTNQNTDCCFVVIGLVQDIAQSFALQLKLIQFPIPQNWSAIFVGM